jgi:hypothetical protein
MDFKELGCKGVEWIHQGQDSDQWQASVNMTMSSCVLQKLLLSASQLLKNSAAWSWLSKVTKL